MLWHVYTTRACNLQCRYCGSDPRFETIPLRPEYSPDELVQFLSHDKSPTINFYGGEPLLNIPFMTEVMDKASDALPNVSYVLQTNGTLLHKVPTHYLAQLHSILVSVDGRPSVTDYYRGKGVYEQVRQNVSSLTQWLHGELVARMTVSKNSNIYEEVTFLLGPDNPGFTHVHWQLDALWNSEVWDDFPTWVAEEYNPGITKLAKWWLAEVRDKHIVPKIVPFLGVLTTLIDGSRTQIRCGAGVTSFTVSTDRKIVFCPIEPEDDTCVVGHLKGPDNIRKVPIGPPCTSCPELDVCGGRCLFVNQFHTGSEEDFSAVCASVKHLISEMRPLVPLVQQAVEEGWITKEEVHYPDINNGCEIIP